MVMKNLCCLGKIHAQFRRLLLTNVYFGDFVGPFCHVFATLAIIINSRFFSSFSSILICYFKQAILLLTLLVFGLINSALRAMFLQII